jgi:hypothetical protein
LSEALAETVTVPETVALLEGAVIETVGDVVSEAVEVVNVASLLVARFPGASFDFAR